SLGEVCRETLDWALREMRAPEGGFYSALDADSEGVEGKFYVWSIDELRDVLGDDADEAIAWFGATQRGNFEGANILESRGPEPAPEVRERIRKALMERRAGRIRPGLDDKRLTAWNALMISALAEAGAVLERDDYLAAARRAAAFVLDEMREPGPPTRLLRTYNAGEAKLNAYLEDHAFLLEALLTLYEATFEARWFHAARELADSTIERFGDPDGGGFFQTSSDHEQLVARRKEIDDSPIPSGQSSAAFGLLRLAALTGEARYEEAALGVLQLFGDLLRRSPLAFGHLLQALDFHLAPTQEVALLGSDTSALARTVRAQFRPHIVLAGGDGEDDAGVPLLEGRVPHDGRAAAYVCERFACKRPVTEPDELQALLGSATAAADS
ncbi:MAG: thioredoxin domain-containing protein, partial [Actinomycetota bacterium]|nr:thioredoxin domain-containing protein [Actinomycetota bacterium]